MRCFHGGLIIHHSLISLCFHAREKPLLCRTRLLQCLHCRPAGLRGRRRPRLSAVPALPVQPLCREQGRRDAGLPQLCWPVCSPDWAEGTTGVTTEQQRAALYRRAHAHAGNCTLVTKGLGVSHSQPVCCSQSAHISGQVADPRLCKPPWCRRPE